MSINVAAASPRCFVMRTRLRYSASILDAAEQVALLVRDQRLVHSLVHFKSLPQEGPTGRRTARPESSTPCRLSHDPWLGSTLDGYDLS